jgi:peroxiredoxin Q/BCP
MALPKLGNLAPAFTLINQDGDKVSLKDYKGKQNVVVYLLAKLDTVVLGISPDPQKRLQNFITKQELNFDLLSDEDHSIADKYGAWGPKKFMGREYDGILRSSFIVGKDGRLKHIMDKVKTKSHHDDVIDWIKANL